MYKSSREAGRTQQLPPRKKERDPLCTGWGVKKHKENMHRAAGPIKKHMFVYDVLILSFRVCLRMVGRYLERFLKRVAPSRFYMSPWRAMGNPFVPKIICFLHRKKGFIRAGAICNVDFPPTAPIPHNLASKKGPSDHADFDARISHRRPSDPNSTAQRPPKSGASEQAQFAMWISRRRPRYPKISRQRRVHQSTQTFMCAFPTDGAVTRKFGFTQGPRHRTPDRAHST